MDFHARLVVDAEEIFTSEGLGLYTLPTGPTASFFGCDTVDVIR